MKRRSDTESDIKLLVEKVSTAQELEALGKTLSPSQAIDIISSLADNPDQKWKLQPILVGISPETFSVLLHDIDPITKQKLLRFSTTEPLQHHMSLFCHELVRFSDEADRQILLVDSEINSLRDDEIHTTNIRSIERTIAHFTEDYKKELNKIENALSIAWYGQSGELIDLLSTFKEQYQRVMRDIIGVPRKDKRKPTGLYEVLENKLSRVFDDADSSIAALTKFSLWYAKDYWEAGLLPRIKSPDKLELPQLRIEQDAKLRSEVEENLKQLGLGTVNDFKRLGIFSKKMLLDYIKTKTTTNLS